MIVVSVTIPRPESHLEHLGRQLPFAVSLAINRVGEAARNAVRDSLDPRFTIAPSKERFLKSLVAREHMATKAELWTVVGIGKEFGSGPTKDRAFLLARHEHGGQKVTHDPRYPFAIPTDELRGGDRALVQPSMYPKALRLLERRDVTGTLGARGRVTRRGKVQLQGKRRTFVIDARDTADPDAWGIFQRFGPGPRDIRMLWAFRRRIALPPRLRFQETVTATVNTQFSRVFAEAWERAVATARPA